MSRTNTEIAKYVFIVLIIINILTSIWVIIYDLKMVKKIQIELPDDWHLGEKHEGSTAKYWFIGCVIIMIANIVNSLVALYGAKNDHFAITMICSTLFSVIAVYGAWDKYMKGSITSFLVPLIVHIVGILFGSLNFYETYGRESVPGGYGPRIKYVSAKPQPATPSFEDANKRFHDDLQLEQNLRKLSDVDGVDV